MKLSIQLLEWLQIIEERRDPNVVVIDYLSGLSAGVTNEDIWK